MVEPAKVPETVKCSVSVSFFLEMPTTIFMDPLYLYRNVHSKFCSTAIYFLQLDCNGLRILLIYELVAFYICIRCSSPTFFLIGSRGDTGEVSSSDDSLECGVIETSPLEEEEAPTVLHLANGAFLVPNAEVDWYCDDTC